ncbi:S-adenosyl-L-methionine-dependent methyltransferase [Cadophora sp. DSE1049]|nr:S-adenosyl-L-methionine-dependent methyltransferase [Cadophora sp. DSE1049]
MCTTDTPQLSSTTIPPLPGQSVPAPTQAGPLSIEADEADALDNDSAFGDDASDASSRTSLSSGIARYRIENGRRYHAYKEGNYLLPNDDAEQDRLDLHHHVFNLVTEGKLFHAPIDNPSRVLDAGTGTGIWAMDFADQFPGSYVLGTDLSPIQPGWVPPNLEFEVDDMEDVWRHKPFSYIHLQSLAGSLKDWPRLLSQAYENLEPGGWLEVVDFELYCRDQRDSDAEAPGIPEVKDAKHINMWVAGLHEAADKIGRTFRSAGRCKEWMEDVGFGKVAEQRIKAPLAPWAKNRRQKEIGIYQQQVMLDASSAYGAAHFTRVLGWTSEEFEVLSAGVRQELKDRTLQLYSNLYVIYGRKPEREEGGENGGEEEGDG